jgi:ABC-2 type transport system permease protein
MKLARDTWLMFVSSLMGTLREPAWVLAGLTQPLFYLALFAPLLEGVARAPGFPPGGALGVFVPGLIVQLGLFGAAFAGFGLIAELRAGVIERLRVTPVSRAALLLGRALRDVVILLAQALLIVLVAWPFGLRFDPAGLVIALGLLALLGLVFASCSYALALALRSEYALGPVVNTVTFPLLLLSGVLLPLTFAPGWLRAVAALNPLSHAVDATRALFAGRLGEPATARALLIWALLAAVSVWAGARAFSRAAA